MTASPSLGVLLREDVVRHGSRLNHPGSMALHTYRFGTWRDALPNGKRRKLLRLPYLVMHRRLRNRHRIELHYTATLGRRVRLSSRGDIVIGNRVVVGDDCTIGQGVTLGKTRDDATGWPVIGDRVLIGPGVVIAGDIHIGDDVVVGPNSVVLADVPAGARVSARSAVPETTPAGGLPGQASTRPYASAFDWLPFGSKVRRRLWQRRRIVIGHTAHVGTGLRLARDGNIAIGEQVTIGRNGVIGYGATVGWRAVSGTKSAAATHLGDRVVLGAGAVVLAGVTVGDDVRIGINAVVADDVPPGTGVACPPAAVLRSLRLTSA